MALENKSIGGVTVTPELVAELFWDMASDEMADFFAQLDRIAGIKLCMQMAYVIQELQERSAKGDYRPLMAFQTMLAHSQSYTESAIENRVFDAKYAIERHVKGVKASLS